MKNFCLVMIHIAVSFSLAAQNVGIGTTTPHASAAFEIKSNNKGILLPRTSTASRNAIVNPAKGLMLYDSTAGSFWFYNGAVWSNLSTSVASGGWLLTGNSGTNPVTNFIGTVDAQPFVFRVNNVKAGFIDNSEKGNLSLGYLSLAVNTTGHKNTALGHRSLAKNTAGYQNTATGDSALYANTNGFNNTANGSYALQANVSGQQNTAMGYSALVHNVNGNLNTAMGTGALYQNLSGINNVAGGAYALFQNTTGQQNTANGYAALNLNVEGNYNTATGAGALNSNVESWNTAMGAYALYLNTTGYSNVAIGASALYNSSNLSNLVAIGDSALFNQGPFVGGEFPVLGYNTAVGSKSLFANDYGQANTANGYKSLYNNSNGTHNTAMGISALNGNTGGSYNTAIGAFADVSSGSMSNTTSLGYGAVATGSNQVMLGNAFVTSVRAAGSFVIYSDGRYKNNIRDDVPGLAFIKMLKAVSYHYDIHKLQSHLQGNHANNKNALNSKQDEEAIHAKEKKLYSGFIAQDVEAAAAKLNYDFSGLYKPQSATDAYGLSYADFVVPLVKAVQEQQAIIEDQNKKILALQKENEKLSAMQADIEILKAAAMNKR